MRQPVLHPSLRRQQQPSWPQRSRRSSTPRSLDPATGALVSLKLKSSGRELLGGPANVIVAEQPKKKIWSPADHMVDRPERDRVTDSNQNAPKLTVTASPLATVVEAESPFIGGGKLRRKMIFHNNQPRIDFETELNDIPDRTVVVAEFPLAAPVREVRRGIPYGFSHAAGRSPTPRCTASPEASLRRCAGRTTRWPTRAWRCSIRA